MYKQLKDDGFTLVEIIVSIAIGTVALTLVLSVIITSFNTFGDVSNSGLNKESLNRIVDYVNDQIKYASDVVVSQNGPTSTGWKWIYVQNGILYHGSSSNQSGSKVLPIKYYNKSTETDSSKKACILSMTVKSSHMKNSSSKRELYKSILSYVYSNSKESTKRKDTITFDNMSGSDSTQSESIKTLAENKSSNTFSLSTYKLYYYKTSNSNVEPQPKDDDVTYTHTVADKIRDMTAYMNRGYYTGNATSYDNNGLTNTSYDSITKYAMPNSNTYRVGDVVYYQGYYWQLLVETGSNTNNPPGGSARAWQRLSEDYDSTSPYLKGDIVKYNGDYYECLVSHKWGPTINYDFIWKKLDNISSTSRGYDPTYSTIADINTNISSLTSSLTAYMNNLTSNKVPDNSPFYQRTTDQTEDKVYATKFNLSANHTFNENLDGYDPNNFNVGDVIQVKVNGSSRNDQKQSFNTDVTDSNDTGYYRLYKKIFNPMDNLSSTFTYPGSSCLSGWELLENTYYPGSSYKAGDTLRYTNKTLSTTYSSDMSSNTEILKINSLKAKTSITSSYYKFLRLYYYDFTYYTYFNKTNYIGDYSSFCYIADSLHEFYSSRFSIDGKNEIIPILNAYDGDYRYVSDFYGDRTRFNSTLMSTLKGFVYDEYFDTKNDKKYIELRDKLFSLTSYSEESNVQ